MSLICIVEKSFFYPFLTNQAGLSLSTGDLPDCGVRQLED